MKYIMLKAKVSEESANDVYLPIIFPPVMTHKDVAKSMQHLIRMKHQWDCEVVSAGFLNSAQESYGESESLKLVSRPEDTKIIKMYDYSHGFIGN